MQTSAAAAAKEEHVPDDRPNPVFGSPTGCPYCRQDEEACSMCRGTGIAHMSIQGPGAIIL